MKRFVCLSIIIVLVGLAVHTRLYVQGTQPTFLTNDEIVNLVHAQLAAKALDQVATFLLLPEIQFEQKINVLTLLTASGSYGLSAQESARLMLAVANGYPVDSPEQQRLLDMIFAKARQEDYIQLFTTAAECGYIAALQGLISYMSTHTDKVSQTFGSLEAFKSKLFYYAIEQKQDEAFKQLITHFGGISPQQATNIAWQVVADNDKPRFLAELKALGADLNSVREGKTLLVYAVMIGNDAIVRELADLGVDLNKFADPAVGTPLQQAFINGFQSIETFLRERGAREI